VRFGIDGRRTSSKIAGVEAETRLPSQTDRLQDYPGMRKLTG